MDDILLPHGFERIDRIIELVADAASLHPSKAAGLVWQLIETNDVRLFERGGTTWWKDCDAAAEAQGLLRAQAPAPAGRYNPLAYRRSFYRPRSERPPAPPSGRELFTGTVHIRDIERGLARLGIDVLLDGKPGARRQSKAGRRRLAPWDVMADELLHHLIANGGLHRTAALDWARQWCQDRGYRVDAPSTLGPYVDDALQRYEAHLEEKEKTTPRTGT